MASDGGEIAGGGPRDPQGGVEEGEGAPDGDRPLGPESASERENVIDESTAGDGVAFFEGGEGQGSVSARGDVERSG